MAERICPDTCKWADAKGHDVQTEGATNRGEAGYLQRWTWMGGQSLSSGAKAPWNLRRKQHRGPSLGDACKRDGLGDRGIAVTRKIQFETSNPVPRGKEENKDDSE